MVSLRPGPQPGSQPGPALITFNFPGSHIPHSCPKPRAPASALVCSRLLTPVCLVLQASNEAYTQQLPTATLIVTHVPHAHSPLRSPLSSNLPRPPCTSLADFGFANRSGLKNSLLSTFCGSVAYTAPEILMSKKYNGEQADLWSL